MKKVINSLVDLIFISSQVILLITCGYCIIHFIIKLWWLMNIKDLDKDDLILIIRKLIFSNFISNDDLVLLKYGIFNITIEHTSLKEVADIFVNRILELDFPQKESKQNKEYGICNDCEEIAGAHLSWCKDNKWQLTNQPTY